MPQGFFCRVPLGGGLLVLYIVARKQFRRTLNERLFPTRKEHVFEVVFPTDLGATLGTAQHFEHNPGFELGAKRAPFCHDNSPFLDPILRLG